MQAMTAAAMKGSFRQNSKSSWHPSNDVKGKTVFHSPVNEPLDDKEPDTFSPMGS
jgi:hypothetical protein